MKRVHEYTAFFETNERGGYTVTVPALPGLVTEGKDLDNARDMAKDAIRCYERDWKRPSSPCRSRERFRKYYRPASAISAPLWTPLRRVRLGP